MRRSFSTAVATLAMLVVAAPALAGPIDDYRRNGSIDACKYSDGQLKQGLKNLPPDVEQYAPGLADQLNGGREGCSSGGANNRKQSEAVPGPSAPGNGGGSSGGGGAGATSGGAAAGATAGALVPDPPSPVITARQRLAGAGSTRVSSQIDQGPPGWVTPLFLILLAVAAVIALARLGGANLARFTRPLGASFTEAGGRTSDSMAELWDRVRLGR